MPPTAIFRVRIWRGVEGWSASNVELIGAAREATRGDPARAATIETNGGEGPVIVIAIGSGDIHYGPAWESNYDPVDLFVRTWEVEEAYEDVGAADLPDALLGEYREALIEEGLQGVRLLTAEQNFEDGRAVILAAYWFDSDFEAQQRGEYE